MKILGRQEKLYLPDVSEHPIAAKVDTGATTSALHCTSIQPYVADDGQLMVRFVALDVSYKAYTGQLLSLPVVQTRTVRSSNGQSEQRYYVALEVVLGTERFSTWFSLTKRHTMSFPILIGRSLLSGRYIVDVSKKSMHHS
ncbi:MAG: RimK/LysX family protein [Bacteroidetes bacterium]|jgi:hypothetical protein|nr:RimK/LysX family protein [Bacteroidota bacterium]